ncbi:2OG-Fe dioxygenase family protein [uncultured Caballeronia sp.]|uniref:2OG-Fe dioxygenase family protein n=1 Tax=uncultured Caballeronia sp. TaxID=1827198 RepID=UPI0035CB39A4
MPDHSHARFHNFYESQLRPDPYASVRDRGMIKLIYDRPSQQVRKNENQNYFQSYSANDSDGGRVRVFAPISDELVTDSVFLHILKGDAHYINKYCHRAGVDILNISVHFIRYRAEEGYASFSSPVWLHLDDEPLVLIHLIDLTPNAIGADSVISGMDSKPTNVLRLQKPFDTLIVDRTKKHAVTPLGSSHGTSYRDVMLVNVEAEVRQK